MPAGDSPRCRVRGNQVRLRADDTAGKHDARSPGGLLVSCPGTGRPPGGEPPCLRACRPAGTMGWPVPCGPGKVHDSTHVCGSPAHQEEAGVWVHGTTGHDGVFRAFAAARAAS